MLPCHRQRRTSYVENGVGVLSPNDNVPSVPDIFFPNAPATIADCGTLANDESHHLRETRVMKSRAGDIMKGKDSLASKYEVVKVLGKGSFGVVRLVREKSDNP